MRECKALYYNRKASWIMYDPAKKLPEFSLVPKKTDKLHRICLSSKFFFMKTIINFSTFCFLIGFKIWMQNDFIPHKDIYTIFFLVIGMAVCKIVEVVITVIGRIFK